MNTSPENKIQIVGGYIPVIHQGYMDILNQYSNHEVIVFGPDIIDRHDYLRKDIRALSPELVISSLRGIGRSAILADTTEVASLLNDPQAEVVLFDDDVSKHTVNATEQISANVSYESPFLRWDRNNVSINEPITPDRVIESSEISVLELNEEAQKSTDWWRQVAAGVVINSEITLKHNRAMPNEYSNSIEGDPRIVANRGSDIEKSLFIHAEADLIAYMAKEGIKTEGQSIYVTTFPCPNCARLIAASGFKKCYFVDGYSMLDGERVLKAAGIEIIQIISRNSELSPKAYSRLRPYPEKSIG